MRESGILLHITSLPSPYGVGTLGQEARDFVDFLAGAGQTYWQILPTGPTGYGDSPYQTFSAFAGNPYLLDLDTLIADELLTGEEVSATDWGDSPESVDFGKLYENRFPLLRRACERGYERDREAVKRFSEKNGDWLFAYALFMAAKDHFGKAPWYEWPEALRACRGEAPELAETLSDGIRFYTYIQFLFYKQWAALRAYANDKGIRFIGDIPIYVPLDSADVWASPESFQLDEHLRPTVVAGVPPDSFTADGQLWGNPIYDWDAMAKDGFRWWKSRLNASGKLFDVVRLDHFRGLSSYWAVPNGDKTAKNGEWREGPGRAFITTVRESCPGVRFIAEDLGYLTPDVRALVAFSGFPGMKVLEFAFDSRERSNYLPHTYEENCVCYVGTHDNATLTQWLEELCDSDRAYAKRYLGLSGEEGYARGVIRGGMASVAALFVAQMQDWLELGAEARMNTPGSFGAPNWRWRMKGDALTPMLQKRIYDTTVLYGRDRR